MSFCICSYNTSFYTIVDAFKCKSLITGFPSIFVWSFIAGFSLIENACQSVYWSHYLLPFHCLCLFALFVVGAFKHMFLYCCALYNCKCLSCMTLIAGFLFIGYTFCICSYIAWFYVCRCLSLYVSHRLHFFLYFNAHLHMFRRSWILYNYRVLSR